MGHAGGNPAPDTLIEGTAGLEPGTAPVGDLGRGLAEQETLLRRRWENAPTAGLLDNSNMAEADIESQERQGKSVLHPSLAVAGNPLQSTPRPKRARVHGEC